MFFSLIFALQLRYDDTVRYSRSIYTQKLAERSKLSLLHGTKKQKLLREEETKNKSHICTE